jgi:hypothetical protein
MAKKIKEPIQREPHIIEKHLNYLNTNKFFAGIIIILLNIGSKVINVQLSKSAEEYLKMSITQQILVFAMSWMGTRDIVASLILTSIFVICSEYLFNEESRFCIVPKKYHILPSLIDINNDGEITETEINDAIAVLEKAKNKKKKEIAHNNYLSFNSNLNNN